MRIWLFSAVVPKALRTFAYALVCIAALSGLVLGFFERTIDHLPYNPLATVRGMGIGLGLGLFLAGLLATWLLSLGYVYGDAKRRSMRPVLWILIVILCPHLLGFLLYFVLRQPITTTCSGCGGKNSDTQRFCAWCGNPQPPSTNPVGPAKPEISGPDSMIAV
jgi:hypothetical protein